MLVAIVDESIPTGWVVAGANEPVVPAPPLSDGIVDESDVAYVDPLVELTQSPHSSVSVYPPVVRWNEPTPPDRPPPYAGNNNSETLAFFRAEASADEWAMYHLWNLQYQESRRTRDEELVVLNGITITNGQAYTLRPEEWINDAVLHFVFMSMESTLGLTDVSAVFFPSFFFVKLLDQTNTEKRPEYDFKWVERWNKRLFKGKSVADVKTIVFLQNHGQMHWSCCAIFTDLKIIQAFDSFGGGTEYLPCLYRWLNDSMAAEGKTLIEKEWCLYGTQNDTTRQRDGYNCGLFAVMFGVCVAKRIPWPVDLRARIANARCLLLNHIINVQPERAGPLRQGPVGLFRYQIQEYPFHEWSPPSSPTSSPPTSPLSSPKQKVQEKETMAFIQKWIFEMDTDPPDESPINTIGNQPSPLDLTTPQKKSGPPNEDSVLDLVTPPTKPPMSVDYTPVDLVTPPTKRTLQLPEVDAAATEGTADNIEGSKAGRDDEEEEADENFDGAPQVNGIILSFVDKTGEAGKTYDLYQEALEASMKNNDKDSRAKLDRCTQNFTKAWENYQKLYQEYIDKGVKADDEGLCVSCDEIADKNLVCSFCKCCVHPVTPCSHTTEEPLLCHGCHKKGYEKPITEDTLTKAKTTDAFDETVQPEKVVVEKTDPIQGKEETNADITGTQEDKNEEPDNESTQPEKKKPRKRRGRKAKGVVDDSLLRRSPRNQKKQKSTITENDTQSAVKTLFPSDSPDAKSPPSADATLPKPSATENKPTIESHTKAVEPTDNSSQLEPAATVPSSPKDENESSQKPLHNIDNPSPLVPAASMPNVRPDEIKATALDKIIESDAMAVENIDNSTPLVPAATMPNPRPDENKARALDNIDNSEPLGPAATMPNPPADEIGPSLIELTASANKYDADDDDVKPSARKPNKAINDSDDDDVKPSAKKSDKAINDDDPDDEQTESENDFPGQSGSKEKDSDEEEADNAEELDRYLNSLQDSSQRRKNRGPTWYSDLREARQKMTPEDIREEKRLIKKKRRDEAEEEKNRVKMIAKRNAKAAADYRNGHEERQKKKRERFQQRKKDKQKAEAIYKKHYKKDFDNRQRIAFKQFKINMTLALGKDFPETNKMTKKEENDWDKYIKEAAKFEDDEMTTKIEDVEMVKEMKSLMYIPALWIEGLERGTKRKNSQLDTRAHFFGMVHNSETDSLERYGPLNPDWVEYYFDGVFVELTKLQPRYWWPVVLGNSREEDDLAPEELMVTQVKIQYPQFDRELCLVNSVASTLYHCGEKEAARQLMQRCSEFQYLTKPLALKQLKEIMRDVVPCIGDCEVFNQGKAKKNKIKKLSIEELINKKTRFPTVVVPLGKDGSNNHAIVVINDLILDSTQAFAMKLCRESLDWICGDMGIDVIDVALRFNRSHGTKKKLQYADAKHW
jgi:sentrin-specific protease 1